MANWSASADNLNQDDRAPMAILPGWFVERMMSEKWYYGLLLSSGSVLAIQCIDRVYAAVDGSVWIDVTLAQRKPLSVKSETNVIVAPTLRLEASVNTAHVVAAFELADT